MRVTRLVLIVLLVVVALGPATRAQNLPYSLFERYLQSLRQQAGIPGLSAAIVQDRRIVWDSGFGHQDVESANPATANTPYLVADLTQTLAATLLLQCVEQRQLDLDAPMARWTTAIPEPGATVRQVMSHSSHSAQTQFKYDPARYSSLTPVIEACGREPYRKALAKGILYRLGMADSVPGSDLTDLQLALRIFDDTALDRYAAVLRRVATPYRVDGGGKPSRSGAPPKDMNASTGLVSTVRDLARFDAALDDLILLDRESLDLAWTNVSSSAGRPLPAGLGWFVQGYDGERIVWHVGVVRDSYSSLVVKVPARSLTLILLANSDGLARPPSITEGDVTSSVFAKLFLALFI